jgi:hypothetical protein
MYFFSVEKPLSFFTNHFTICREPQDERNFCFRILLNLASSDAEFDADFEFQVENWTKWNFYG